MGGYSVEERLAKVEERLDNVFDLVKGIDSDVKSMSTNLNSFMIKVSLTEERMQNMETRRKEEIAKSRWVLVLAATVVSAFMSVIVSVIFHGVI
jgi:hypothetical protein